MTTTYDPFTPAGASEQPGYGGRRRSDERTWADEPVQIPEQRWAQEPQDASHWTTDPRWGGDERQDWRAAPAEYSAPPTPTYQAGSYSAAPGYAGGGYSDGGYPQAGGYPAAEGYARTGSYPPAADYGSAVGYPAPEN